MLFDYCVKLIPLPPAIYYQCFPDIFFLHHLTHHHCSHFWDLYLATNTTLFHIPTCCLQTLYSKSLFLSVQAIFQRIFTNGTNMVANLLSAPYTCFCRTMLDGMFFILATDYFTFIPVLSRTSQKGKCQIQYELGVAFYRTLLGPFILNTSFRYILSFLLGFTCFLTSTMSPVSNSLSV